MRNVKSTALACILLFVASLASHAETTDEMRDAWEAEGRGRVSGREVTELCLARHADCHTFIIVSLLGWEMLTPELRCVSQEIPIDEARLIVLKVAAQSPEALDHNAYDFVQYAMAVKHDCGPGWTIVE